MKDDSVMTRFAAKLGAAPGGELEAEPSDDLGTFGWLRVARDRAIMLELRLKTGNVTAFPYAWLERIDFDPSTGVTLKFSQHTVKIIGRGFNREAAPSVSLLAGLLRHRVPWIQETDDPTALAAPKNATLIEGIEIIENTMD